MNSGRGSRPSGRLRLMVTMTMEPRPAGKILLPTREEIRDMLWRSPAVAITALLCLTLFALAALGAVVFLAYTKNDTAVIGALIGGPLVGVLGLLVARVRALQENVKTMQSNTTGDGS